MGLSFVGFTRYEDVTFSSRSPGFVLELGRFITEWWTCKGLRHVLLPLLARLVTRNDDP